MSTESHRVVPGAHIDISWRPGVGVHITQNMHLAYVAARGALLGVRASFSPAFPVSPSN